MHWIDWIMVLIPLTVVIVSAVLAQRHVHGVADFLSAGRVAGRYVLSVSSGMASMGLITLIGMAEMYYNSGFTIAFWLMLSLPFIFFISMTGFCTYRFRETRALTMGQFFEIRYNKAFRLTAAVIQSVSGIINYAIFPAVGARFLIYYLNFPLTVTIGPWTCSTAMLVMAAFLSIAWVVSSLGGQVTIMVTDCVQGILSYPMFLAIILFFFFTFSWSNEVVPALSARAPGESLLNPFDSASLADFNLFYVFAGIVGMFIGHLTWGGTQGYNCSARTPHESKMGNLLGRWRTSFSDYMYILIAVIAFTFMNHAHFAQPAHAVRHALADTVLEETAHAPALDAARQTLHARYGAIPQRTTFSTSYATKDAYRAETADPFVRETNAILEAPDAPPGARKAASTFRSVYTQMTVPVAVRHILPVGLTGIFCALMIFLMLSTDTTYMHSWGSILVQDLVVPLLRKPLTPKTQIRVLRCMIALVALFAFVFSSCFAQFDFIIMFFSITGALWAGAGAVITLGLYWKRGTTAGAFASLIVGAMIALTGFLLQQHWAEHVYPFLANAGWLGAVTAVANTVTDCFGPYITWTVNPQKFPINSQEILFITNITSLLCYILVSYATCKTPFNLERMLHRGRYRVADVNTSDEPSTTSERKVSRFTATVLGIDADYSRGDRIIAWAAFLWSFVYIFGASFLAVVIWNLLSPWPLIWWSRYFFVTVFLGSIALGVVFAVWFGICGTHDLFALFRDLSKRTAFNDNDDGRVVDHQSAADFCESTPMREE